MLFNLLTLFIFIVANFGQQIPPKFSRRVLTFAVSEEASPGYVIGYLNQYVINSDPSNVLRYWIDSAGAQKFQVDSKNGRISVKEKLDRENVELFNFECFVADNFEDEERVDKSFVYLTITDVNDNAPNFQGTNFVNVYENATIGSTILTLTATDPDYGVNSEIVYTFKSKSDIFDLDANNGEVTLKNTLNYEISKNYILRVVASDKGVPSLNTTSILTINILDVNDTNPVFQSSPYNIQVKENVPVGSSILRVHAFDGDTGINAPIIYNLRTDGDAQNFVINQTTGVVSIAQHLDREMKFTYSIKVDAIEKDDPTSSSTADVIIFVQDVNDNNPVFISAPYEIIIGENTPIGSVIKQGFTVIDADILPENNQFTFSLNDPDNNFIINSTTGYLSVQAKMDFETSKQFNFTVIATESLSVERFSGNAAVTVKLENENDNKPMFKQKSYTFKIQENVDVGYFLGIVEATDADLGSFGIVAYNLQGTNANKFKINTTNGNIYVNGNLDFEMQPNLEFSVIASDGAPFNKQTDVTSVYVQLSDVNDNAPVIINLPVIVNVNENALFDDLFTVQATDADTEMNSNMLFMITNTSESEAFVSINATIGVVQLLRQLDFEMVRMLWVQITVKDQGSPSLQSDATLTINVVDTNDNAPIFNQSIYTGIVSEVVDISTSVVQVFATDLDSGTNGALKYKIASGNEELAFEISQEGIISTRNILDRENRDTFNLTVVVQDSGIPALESECFVILKVLDHNDKAPIFTKLQYSGEIIESAAAGTVIVTVSAVDEDIGSNAAVVYSIQSGNNQGLFAMNWTTGELYVHNPLDWEHTQLFTLIVKAEDQGKQTNARTAVVTIRVLDDNDNAPQFVKNSYSFQVFEKFPEQTTVGYVSATDNDGQLPPNTNGVVSYNITNGNWNNSFAIDANFGTIRTNKVLDREALALYNLTITATDGGLRFLFSSVMVLVIIQDLNDNQPLFQKSSYYGVVSENVTIGTSVAKVSATDADEGTNGDVTYLLSNHNDLFAVTHEGVIAVKGYLDFETRQSFSLFVIAQDSAVSKMTSTVQLLINVTDVNDNAPTFELQPYHGTVYEARIPGEYVITVRANDVDTGSNSHISYSIVQSVPVDYVFNINSSTGAISTNATLNRDIHQLYNITVKAKDDGVPSLESEVNVVVAVLDSNTHAPLVRNLPNFVNVSEAITEGLDVFKVNATDNDMGDNAKLLFHIKDGSDGKFVIDVNNGIIRTSSTPTDYEIKSRYNLTVEVFDRGNPPLMILSTLIIRITDINDNTPVFDPNPNLYPQAYISSVKEGSKIYTEVIRVYAVDHDEGSNAKIIYSITEDIGNYFSINASSGVVVLITDIDRESTSVQKDLNGFGILSLIITATDFGSSPQSSSVKVVVLISDDNDNAPMFSESVYKATVTEGASLGSDVTTVNAIDIDLGFNAQVSYYIVEGNVDGSFRIHRLSGKISVAKLLNKEETSVYNLTIMAEDDATFLGEKPLNSTALVQILISDVNDNDPVFAESFYTTTVVENVIAGTPVKNITATDADTDENGQVWYEIIAGNIDNTFRIDNITGEVFTQGDIDYEILSSFTITVKAEDFGKPAPRKTTVDLLITVANVNDNKPHFELSSYVGLIFENKQTNTRISFSKPIFATDADDSNHLLLSYQITGTDSMYFSISTKTAEILSEIMFDRELKDSYNFTVQVKDTDGQFSTANVTVIIQDMNDNNPQFNETIKNIELSESAVIDTIVYTVVATDKDIGLNGNILYSMQGGLGFFQIDQQKGVIKLIQALDWEDKTSYILTISARDSGTPSKQSNMSVHIKVSNIYDIRPYFNPDKLSLNIHENVTVGSVIVVASAIDLDLNDILTYNITSVSQNNTFEINSTTGELYTVNRLDREAISIYTLTVQATDLAGLQSLRDGLKITVNILDANDNKPIFTIKTCGNDVIEDAQNNTIVLTVLANDADLDLNAFVVYSLSPDVENLLSIDADRGLVKKIGSFQPYVASFLNFTVFAQDKGDTPQRSSINCSLKIVDVNNNSPKFNQSNYEVYVMENVSIGYHVAMFTASEKDQGDNALINYSFVDDNAFFAVNKTTSVITTIGKLDRELQDVIIVKLIAQDNGSPPLQSVTSVTFYVTDINDERPVFNEDQYTMVVTEDVNIGTSIGQVSAMDSDTGINAVVEYTFPVNMSSTYFRINETTGILYTIGRLDREIIDQFTLTVKAYDLGHPSLSSTTDVMVMVNDVNDNRPQFNQTRYYVDIYENIFGGSTVLVLHASDPDLGDNGKLVYKIFAGNEAGHFSLGESSGALAVINRLDIETQPIYNLTVKASDHGLPSLSTMTNVVVTLKDVNDKPPEFPQSLYSFTVYENTTLHSIIGVIIATDADETEKYNTIYYRLEKNNTFMIDRMNGSIILKKSLDREVTDEYNLKTTAYNLENSVETLSKTVDVHIKILDANDNHPVFPLSCCSVNVSEGLQANEIVFTFQATDEDVGSNSLITYILSNEKDSFTLSPTSGVLTLKTEFDRELQSTHSLHIMATDHGTPSLSTNVTLLINVADINDEPPKFLNMSINIPPENSPIGVYITTFTAQDRDLGSNQLISYSIIAGNENGDLVLNSTTGILRTANLLDYETTPLYRLQVEAVDHGVPPLSVHKLFTIPVGNINDNSPSFDGGVLPTGSVKESSPVGTIVATILAVDPDGDPIYYTIIKGNDDGSFEISSTTGVLKTANLLDREVKSQYSLVVEASNAVKRKKRNVNGNAPTSVTIAINIEDQNDNPPQFIQQVFSGGVSESAKYGTSILRIQASDADTGNDSILHYEIIGDSNVFHIHQLTGWITSKELFAGQTGQLYQLNVVVKDNNGKANYYSDTAVVKIFVLTDLQRIVLTMKSDPTLVQQHRQDFIDILQNVTKYTVNIDEIQYATNSERVYDFTRTDLLFHAVDPTTNEILDRDVVIRNMDDNYALLQAFFDKWNVTKYEGKVSPVVDSEDDNTTMKIIIAVIVCIVLLFILFVIIVCRWRNRQKRKLKAVTTSAMKSDAELKNISSPSLFSPIHGLPSTFTFDTDPTLVKVDTFAIPEDISDSPRRRVDTSSKFSTFYGANTLEAKDQNGASYLEPTDVEEDDENLKPRNLTLLDVIATQDYEGKQVVGLDNKGVDDDEYFSESEDGLSETAESTADLLEDDDIIPDSAYGIRNNGNHNNNNNNNSSNSNNSNSNNRNNIGATIGTTYRRNGMLVTSM